MFLDFFRAPSKSFSDFERKVFGSVLKNAFYGGGGIF